jgi:GTP-binding protein LepA
VLNDASFFYEPETSSAFGFGFRCGFLGLLHLEIVIERLEREFDLSLIVTPPSVEFMLIRNNDEEIIIRNPSEIEKYTDIKKIKEKYCEINLLFPKEYLGPIMQLLSEKRAVQEDINYLSTTMVKIKYKLPLLELVTGFYDNLKSISQGFASLDYEILNFEDGNLAKLDILVNGQIIDSFSSILAKENAEFVGRNRVKKLSELIPRQQFDIPIQAAVGSRIIARETIKALRKDVTAKLYGGDITRKRKLLEKQKDGKKKMRQIGKVNVPKEAFRDFLKQ